LSEKGCSAFWITDDPRASLLVAIKHLIDYFRLLFQEGLTCIKHAIRVEINIAVNKLGTVLDFGCRHDRIEPRPCLDIATCESGLAVRVLQVDDLNIGFTQTCLIEGLEQEKVRIRSFRCGDLRSFELIHR